ncbi:basic proline-rich protein-like [Accipiter gentilis]|uniref:basic proline-rich protein-like n=1 Tax=Astur gentilis TaxID=8957 RepID=UPI00210F6004|nr:basic proline-rich protein-like [Accipiter gentilis]
MRGAAAGAGSGQQGGGLPVGSGLRAGTRRAAAGDAPARRAPRAPTPGSRCRGRRPDPSVPGRSRCHRGRSRDPVQASPRGSPHGRNRCPGPTPRVPAPRGPPGPAGPRQGRCQRAPGAGRAGGPGGLGGYGLNSCLMHLIGFAESNYLPSAFDNEVLSDGFCQRARGSRSRGRWHPGHPQPRDGQDPPRPRQLPHPGRRQAPGEAGMGSGARATPGPAGTAKEAGARERIPASPPPAPRSIAPPRRAVDRLKAWGLTCRPGGVRAGQSGPREPPQPGPAGGFAGGGSRRAPSPGWGGEEAGGAARTPGFAFPPPRGAAAWGRPSGSDLRRPPPQRLGAGVTLRPPARPRGSQLLPEDAAQTPTVTVTSGRRGPGSPRVRPSGPPPSRRARCRPRCPGGSTGGRPGPAAAPARPSRSAVARAGGTRGGVGAVGQRDAGTKPHSGSQPLRGLVQLRRPQGPVSRWLQAESHGRRPISSWERRKRPFFCRVPSAHAALTAVPEGAESGGGECLPQPKGCACCQPPLACRCRPRPPAAETARPWGGSARRWGPTPSGGREEHPPGEAPAGGAARQTPVGAGRTVRPRRPRPRHLPPNPSPGTGSIPAPGHGKHLPPAPGLINLLPPPSPSTRHFLPATAPGRGGRRRGRRRCRLRPTGPRRAPLPRQAQSRWLSPGAKAAAVPCVWSGATGRARPGTRRAVSKNRRETPGAQPGTAPVLRARAQRPPSPAEAHGDPQPSHGAPPPPPGAAVREMPPRHGKGQLRSCPVLRGDAGTAGRVGPGSGGPAGTGVGV